MARSAGKQIGWLSLPAMRYQNAYVWFVFLSAVDVMLTWTILKLGGVELNPLAAGVIGRMGLDGMVGFKFALVLLVVIMSEAIGRRRDRLGRRLAEWSAALTAIPVVIALFDLLT